MTVRWLPGGTIGLKNITPPIPKVLPSWVCFGVTEKIGQLNQKEKVAVIVL